MPSFDVAPAFMTLLRLLFRPRHVHLPTLWGLVAMAILAGAAAVAAGRHAHAFLALNEPARAGEGEGARVLVIEGWLSAVDLDQARAVIDSGRYAHVLTTGGPIQTWDGETPWPNYAERAAHYLRSRGVTRVPVVAVGAPASAQDRSYLSAVMVRDWLRATGLRADAIDVFSAGVHARRTRLVYRLALGRSIDVGVMAARADDYDPERWWTSSSGVKSVIGEALSLAWTSCCFWPPAAGSHEERWGAPRAASAARR